MALDEHKKKYVGMSTLDRKTAVKYIAQLFSLTLGLIPVTLVNRLLGPESIGSLFIISSWSGLLHQIFGFRTYETVGMKSDDSCQISRGRMYVLIALDLLSTFIGTGLTLAIISRSASSPAGYLYACGLGVEFLSVSSCSYFYRVLCTVNQQFCIELGVRIVQLLCMLIFLLITGNILLAYSFGYVSSTLAALISKIHYFPNHLWQDEVSLRGMLQSIDKALLLRLRQNWVLTSLKQVRFQLVPVFMSIFFSANSIGLYSIMKKTCVLLMHVADAPSRKLFTYINYIPKEECNNTKIESKYSGRTILKFASLDLENYTFRTGVIRKSIALVLSDILLYPLLLAIAIELFNLASNNQVILIFTAVFIIYVTYQLSWWYRPSVLIFRIQWLSNVLEMWDAVFLVLIMCTCIFVQMDFETFIVSLAAASIFRLLFAIALFIHKVYNTWNIPFKNLAIREVE